MIKITIDDRELKRGLSALAKKQIPFATAAALTQTAKQVQAAEAQALPATFNTPTPFTMNAYAVRPATKSFPVASVFMKDVQAAYLAPFEFGGPHFLGSKRGLLVPKNIPLNQYGNLPRGKLALLKGRSDIFVGTITFKRSGETVSGVWQRPKYGPRRAGGKGSKGNTKNNVGAALTGLKLLIRFSDPLPAPKTLGFEPRAAAAIKKNFAANFDAAFANAIATAR